MSKILEMPNEELELVIQNASDKLNKIVVVDKK